MTNPMIGSGYFTLIGGDGQGGDRKRWGAVFIWAKNGPLDRK